MSGQLEQRAKALESRVVDLFRVAKSGALDAVTRQIGRLDVSVNGFIGQDAALMEAIARRVIPEGWEWEVVQPIGPAEPILVMKQYVPQHDNPCLDSCCGSCSQQDARFGSGYE